MSDPLLAALWFIDEPSRVVRPKVVAHVSGRAFDSHITTTWAWQSRM
ncbi:MAG: hypothetical protein NTW58_05960 [Actinobacteria bacterium]|nr:hypothetical protein [Actinomycetota bacterium]